MRWFEISRSPNDVLDQLHITTPYLDGKRPFKSTKILLKKFEQNRIGSDINTLIGSNEYWIIKLTDRG